MAGERIRLLALLELDFPHEHIVPYLFPKLSGAVYAGVVFAGSQCTVRAWVSSKLAVNCKFDWLAFASRQAVLSLNPSAPSRAAISM